MSRSDHRERELAVRPHFGVGTDVQTGPDGHLYVVSLTKGAVYEIAPRED